MKPVEYKVSFVPCSTRPIRYDADLCIGCNRCVSVCQCDILLPSATKGEHPIVMYPGECYYCGACVMVCPRPEAITLTHPLMNQAKFVPVVK
jgi:NAD-dependent dihydropyrimidine dehydrogenase PreA subunit